MDNGFDISNKPETIDPKAQADWNTYANSDKEKILVAVQSVEAEPAADHTADASTSGPSSRGPGQG